MGFGLGLGPRPTWELKAGTDHGVDSERSQWLHSAGQSTLGVHAAGARFRSRECRRSRSAAPPSSDAKEGQMMPGRASSREIAVTASIETFDI